MSTDYKMIRVRKETARALKDLQRETGAQSLDAAILVALLIAAESTAETRMATAEVIAQEVARLRVKAAREAEGVPN